uniref:Uncharacterized protein n=1 Tax=Virgibacillus oceani TaxID=1479511 RepID=A0A917HBY7_9BACI|nr:hypothetical protein GCM10011398_17950 [Virgibacillus oceani]
MILRMELQQVCKKLQAENQNRELYFHMNNEEIRMIEQPYIGGRRKFEI